MVLIFSFYCESNVLDVLHVDVLQLEAIRKKYDQLEAEVLKQRTKSEEDLHQFKEGEVGDMLDDLNKSRLRIEAKLKQSHQVIDSID